ncbi:MAG TPA: hypothetical protein VGP53_00015, partial [Acidimicrobiales bacterium]|nr:hypothetical protein [Acidimicrobiales bacterium]
WWDTEDCAPGAEADNTPTNLTTGAPEVIQQIVEVPETFFGDYPAYGNGPVCNPKGLTGLGRFVITELADRGMIIETDHMSVKARDEALDILEVRGYGGLITSHSWGDDSSQRRLQALGGTVAPYAEMSLDYAELWHRARELAPASGLPGIGYGTDTNGLGSQAAARPGATGDRPVTYPYTTFDGGTTMYKQQSGSRTYDINVDGAAHYGLFPDWVEDLRRIEGQDIVDDLANGAEAYLQMWEGAQP